MQFISDMLILLMFACFQCESTVDEYGPELFELLVTELDPDTRCSALGFCSAKSVEAILRAAVPKSPPPKVTNSRGYVEFYATPNPFLRNEICLNRAVVVGNVRDEWEKF